ncbi:hypothetical protein M569_09268, partial [Genlisea aurea]
MSRSLPYSMADLPYDNAKFRHRSLIKVIKNSVLFFNIRRWCKQCSAGKFLILLLFCGVGYLVLAHNRNNSSDPVTVNVGTEEGRSFFTDKNGRFRNFWRKQPRLPPRLSPDEMMSRNKTASGPDWKARQTRVKEAFIHAWSGYRRYAMGHDELMPISKRGIDGLGGLGATIVDALDTAMIMGVDGIVNEAGTWIAENLSQRIDDIGQVNLFETTIRIVGGLLSAYHLSGNGHFGGSVSTGPNRDIYLENARKLADHLILAFTLSPSAIPYSDVDLHGRTARPAPDGLSSTAEVSTLQLEFNYLSTLTGDSKYKIESMKVLEHMKTLPKVNGLVPIYIDPRSGEFSGHNIRLGSRGDSYYEYLMKVWLQNEGRNLTYLHDMYTEAMKGVKELLVRKSVPNGLVFVGELPQGPKGEFSPKMDHLVCFLPGTLALGATKGITKEKAMRENLLSFQDLENLQLAEDLTKTCFEMYSVTSTGLSPEIAYFNMEGRSRTIHSEEANANSRYADDIIIQPADRHNLLRPETVESLFVLFRITGNPKYREWGWQIFEAFEKYTKVESGGYSSLDDVTVIPPPARDKMETFFLGETLKYLFLLFGERGIIPLDEFLFNTEAHPFPILRSGV